MNLESVFGALSDSLAGSPAAALAAAFAWGILSVVLSPCHLASIPLIVGFLQSDASVTPRRAAVLSFLFALGILGSIAAIGALTAATGRMLGDLGPWGNYLVAVLFFVFGLHLLDLLPMPGFCRPAANQPRRGPLGAFVFGLIFGVALGPCTFGFIAPVLGVSFSLASTSPIFAFSLLACFGFGHCSVIALAGASTGWVQRWLDWQNKTSATSWLRRICGLLVIAAGFYLLASAR